jgi:DNA-binding transcriptional MerR regulator
LVQVPWDARKDVPAPWGEAVADQKVAPEKLYYSISEVSKLTDVKPYVLRFWEKEFPMLKPKKNRSGNRVYQSKEIELVKKIKSLLYENGFTIEGARQQLRNGRKKARNPSNRNVHDRLKKIEREIQSLIELLS